MRFYIEQFPNTLNTNLYIASVYIYTTGFTDYRGNGSTCIMEGRQEWLVLYRAM